MIGRPPISEQRLRFLREAYDEGWTSGRAAEFAVVHRNTAVNYYRHFKNADDLLRAAVARLPLTSPQRQSGD